MTGSSLDRLLEILFPARCYGCGRRGHLVCERCRERIPWLGVEHCPRCARPSPVARICSRCQSAPSALDGLRAACRLEGFLREMVHDLKYRERTQIAELFASLVGQMLDRRRVQVDALVPVPLSPRRASERGFNQAALVATALGTANGVAVIPAALIRTRETPPQVGRTAADRQKNVAGAFSCPEPIRVAGKRLLLIDDVATTGATVTACAEALKAAGAARVYAAVVAREM